MSDQYDDDDGIRPPEIRDLLLKLHTKAHEIINYGYNSETYQGMFNLAWKIEDEEDLN